MSCLLTSWVFFFLSTKAERNFLFRSVAKSVSLSTCTKLVCLFCNIVVDYSNVSKMLHCITVNVLLAGWKREACHQPSNFLRMQGSLHFSRPERFLEKKSNASPRSLGWEALWGLIFESVPNLGFLKVSSNEAFESHLYRMCV